MNSEVTDHLRLPLMRHPAMLLTNDMPIPASNYYHKTSVVVTNARFSGILFHELKSNNAYTQVLMRMCHPMKSKTISFVQTACAMRRALGVPQFVNHDMIDPSSEFKLLGLLNTLYKHTKSMRKVNEKTLEYGWEIVWVHDTTHNAIGANIILAYLDYMQVGS